MSTSLTRPKLPSLSSRSITLTTTNDRYQTTIEELTTKYQTPNKVSRIIGLSDATGSMANIWDSTRRHITEMINRMSALGSYELKWVAYRDYSEDDKLIESSQWETGASNLLSFINTINCYGGMDWEEAVEKALEVAANDSKATCVILIGDAPPHPERDYLQQAYRLAHLKRPVFSFVVGQAPETLKVFSEISRITQGTCSPLKSADDLLDAVVLTAAHDMGGKPLIDQYLTSHAKQLSSTSKSYAEKLLLLE